MWSAERRVRLKVRQALFRSLIRDLISGLSQGIEWALGVKEWSGACLSYNWLIERERVLRFYNLEVTGEEKPKTRLRRRQANKQLCREKKPVCALPDEERPISLVSDEKSQFAPSSGEKLQQTTFHSRKKIEISYLKYF